MSMPDPNPLHDSLLSHVPVRDGRKALGDLLLLETQRRTRLGAQYLAWHQDREANILLEIQALPPDVASPVTFFEAYSDEMNIVTGLEHDNLITVHDITFHQNFICIAMEFIDGMLLSETIDEIGGMPEDAAQEVLLAIADGLTVGHAYGFTHTDIDPTKIILGVDGEIKLIGLGILPAYFNAVYNRRVPDGVGLYPPAPCTPPELIESLNRTGPASDIWSLGACYFEMLSGQPLWQNDINVPLEEMIRTAPVPDILGIRSDITPVSLTLLQEMLQRDVSDRHPNAQALATSIRQKLNLPLPPKVVRPRTRLDAGIADDGLSADALTPQGLEVRLREIRMLEYDKAEMLQRFSEKEYDEYKASMLAVEEKLDAGDLNSVAAAIPDVAHKLNVAIEIADTHTDEFKRLKTLLANSRKSLELEKTSLSLHEPETFKACETILNYAEQVLNAGDCSAADNLLADFRVRLEDSIAVARQSNRDYKSLYSRLRQLKSIEKEHINALKHAGGDAYDAFTRLYKETLKTFELGENNPDMPKRIEELEDLMNTALDATRRQDQLQAIHERNPELLEALGELRKQADKKKGTLLLFNRDGYQTFEQAIRKLNESLVTSSPDDVEAAITRAITVFDDVDRIALEKQQEYQELSSRLAAIKEDEEDAKKILETFNPDGYTEYVSLREQLDERFKDFIQHGSGNLDSDITELAKILDDAIDTARASEAAERQVWEKKIVELESALRDNPRDQNLQKLLQDARMHLGPPEKLTMDTGGGITLDFVLIPAGRFMMGSPETELNREEQEWQHLVRITNPFYMSVFPITQEHYTRIMGRTISRYPGDKNPVEEVTWEQAMEFCRKLSQITTRRIMLPTEAQWEYAARAGTASAYFFGEDASQLDMYGWYSENAGRKTHPVGQKPPNPFGLYDMYGNVSEWCRDIYDEHYYKTSPRNNPSGPTSGEEHVLRGGSWHRDAGACRSAARGYNEGVNRSSSYGFRIIIADIE